MKVTMNPTNLNENSNPFNAGGQPNFQSTRSNRPSMSLKQTIGVSVATCVVTAFLVGVIGFAIGTKYQSFYRVINKSGSLDYSELDAVYAQLQENYDGKLDKDRLIKGAAAGMAAAVGDPYTNYFTEDEANSFLNDLSGQFEGIGAELGTNKDGQLEVVAPLDDSPAKKAGLQPHDVIVAIDSRNSITMSPSEAITLIRGKAGTVVKLTIMRGSETKEFSITRATIANPSVKWEIKDNNIGYIRISQFGDDTATLTRKAARELKDKKVKGIILDLRGNGGGYVDAAKSVVSLWLSSGSVIVQEKAGDKVVGTEKASGNNILNGVKTIVLIDGGTASASEIVAGALHDHKAATLVGVKTYGKGVVQQLFPLDSGAEVKITIAKWYTPNGNNIDRTGISPDVKVEITTEQYAAGDDAQLGKALEMLK